MIRILSHHLCLRGAAAAVVLFVAVAGIAPGYAQTPSMLDGGGVATQVAAGPLHTCALSASGGVECWGNNYYGQTGGVDTGSNNPNPKPTVAALSSGAVAIAAGGDFSCALLKTGAVQCWGDNYYGQLGNGTNTGTLNPNYHPADVGGLAHIAAIAAGSSHACALTTAGGVKCWGRNYYGELGNSTNNGTQNASPTPADVNGLTSGVAAITAGTDYTCALTTAGGIKCWGYNQYGQLGNNTSNASANPTPSDVIGLAAGVIAIAAGGDQTCALTMAGAVKCWGNNRFGQIGNNTNTNTTNPNPIPADVIGLTGVTAISAGSDSHTCALTVAGGIKCWGWNYFGELGTSTNVTTSNPNPAPVDVSGLGSGMSGITAGGDQTCALTVTGGVQCWGQNKYGQLGNIENSGNVSPNPTPIDVTGFSSGVAAVSAGNEHTCELTNGGGVLCSGNNFFGQLGNVINNLTSNPNPSPLEVTNLASGVDAIAVGSYHSCALTTAGGIKCWGENNLGQLGKSANSGTTNANPSPADVTGLTSGVTAVAAAVGGNHTCALTTGGGVKCWGDNYYGQVGNSTNTGTTNPNATPTDVTGLTSGVSAIASGGHHSCAVTTAGTVKCWGANNEGQLGNTTNVLTSNPNSTPLDVNNLSGVVAIAVGLYHSCALTTTGGVKCWGDNAYGQLGNGTNSGIDTANPTATAVTGLSSGVAAIAAGVYHTCAVTTQGGVKCWGDNDGGQLGSSTNADTTNPNPVPTDVAGLTSGAAALTAGLSHTCALTTQGGLECWGTNSKGQFGTGSTSTSPATTPSTVLAGQSIAFTPSLRAGVGNSVILHAAVSSGLSPFFDIWTPDTCAISAISNDMLVLTQPGICGVRASRAVLSEEGEIADAPQQLRLLHVEADLIFSSSFQSYGGFNE